MNFNLRQSYPKYLLLFAAVIVLVFLSFSLTNCKGEWVTEETSSMNNEHTSEPLEQPTTEGQESKITFFHATDTHLIAGGSHVSCGPHFIGDGRTDCNRGLIKYNFTEWLNSTTNVSMAPTAALRSLVNYVNEQNPDFIVFTGDVISTPTCGSNTEAEYKLLNQTLSGLNVPYYVTAAMHHDIGDNDTCRDMYKKYMGDDMVNWNFTIGNNLFVGLSEWEVADPRNMSEPNSTNGLSPTLIIDPVPVPLLNYTFLDNVLDTYKSRGMKVFLFFHIAQYCYDEIENSQFRCRLDHNLMDVVENYENGFRSFVFLSGHNHANIYDPVESHLGRYHFTTTAVMNYPTQFRIVEVGEDTINLSMSMSVNESVDNVSLTIINGEYQSGAFMSFHNLTFFGSYDDRNVAISLGPVTHMVCHLNSCIEVAGWGENECTYDSDCAVDPPSIPKGSDVMADQPRGDSLSLTGSAEGG